MANITSIMNKLARNAQTLGLTVNSQTASSVVIENGSNDLTIGYIAAQIQAPMGGVDPTVSPYLGIGIANPGQLSLYGASGTTVGSLIDSAVAAQVLQLMSGMANDIVLLSSDATTVLARLRGDSDNLGMGQ